MAGAFRYDQEILLNLQKSLWMLGIETHSPVHAPVEWTNCPENSISLLDSEGLAASGRIQQGPPMEAEEDGSNWLLISQVVTSLLSATPILV